MSANNAPFRYEMDTINNKILIPLGIYRSGINNKGDISVDIKINNDTVSKLISAGSLTGSDNSAINILPSDKYVLPSIVQIKNSEESAVLQLAVDVPFVG